MPDFDLFERIFKSTIAEEMTVAEGALAIASLAEVNKVAMVKDRSCDDLSHFLTRAREAVGEFFPDGTRFSSTDNNRDGKDLLEELSGTEIELKSGGAMTDANSGLAIISWALEDNDARVSAIMKGGMMRRRQLVQQGASPSELDASKAQTMDQLAEFFKSTLSIGTAPDRLAHFFRSVAVGLTKSTEIKAAFNRSGEVKTPLLLEADWDAGLRLYEKAFLPDETLNVVRIERTADRAQVIAQGSQTGRIAKLYPNYKNGWKLRDGSRIDASNWVATACFHVWVT